MGLFSETKTQVGTQIQRVIEDDQLPDAVKTGVTKNIFDKEGDGTQMVEHILEELTSSIALKANRMYEYGRDGYVYGLPESTYHSSLDAKPKVKAHLDALHGGNGALSYYKYGHANLLHMGYMKLMEEFGWNPQTNEIEQFSLQKDTTAYMVDMQVYVVEATGAEQIDSSLEEWGPPSHSYPNPVTKMYSQATQQLILKKGHAVDPAATADYIKVTYAWYVEELSEELDEEGNPKIIKRAESESFDMAIPEYIVDQDYHQVRYITSTGEVVYWMYKPETGLTEIDNVFNMTYSGAGTFFPWVYFRFNKQSDVENTESVAFKSSKKLTKFLNIDYENVGTAINENPDIADVEQAMIMMGIPPDSTNEVDQHYLFDFFDLIQVNTKDYENNNRTTAENAVKRFLGQELADTGITIRDKRFKMNFSFTDLAKSAVVGNIGPVGSYNSVISAGTHVYQHQITEVLYEQITVKSLKMTYFIYGNYTTTGDENNKSIMLIPLDVNIASQYSLPLREKLYSRALHYVFNSRVVTKLKWYQTGIFKAIMIIVAIVITVLSWGSTWQSIGLAVAGGATATTILVMILTQILIQLAYMYAAKLFVKLVGVKVAFIAAIVAAVAGVYVDYGSGVAGAPWGKELLTVSTNLTRAINNDLKSDVEDLMEDYSAFKTDMEAKNKELEEARSLLGDSTRLDPLIVFGETPNEFYQRTVHSGNIGMVGIDAVSSFVDVALQLPKLSDTV